LIIAGFWIGAKVAEYLTCRVRHRMPHNAGLLQLLGRTAKISIMTFGIATALGTIGVNVSALVAGLGLTGFALGFAFRDVLSNLLAGFMILFYRPFRRGDQLAVTPFQGTVIEINLRYTVLRGDTGQILIPNAYILSN